MNGRKKANLLIFFIIGIIAFSIANVASISTNISTDFTNNESQKLILIENDNFTPKHIDQIAIENTSLTNTSENNTSFINGTINTINQTIENLSGSLDFLRGD